MNIAQQLKQVEKKITKIEFELAVEKAVYERLRDIDIANQPSLFGDTQRQTIPGSMPHHIEAVLINSGKPMEIAKILKAVKGRGATGSSAKALENNVRGTLKRRDDLFVRRGRGIYDLRNRHENASKEMESQTEIAQE